MKTDDVCCLDFLNVFLISSGCSKIVLINELNNSECWIRFIDAIITELEKKVLRAIKP